MTGVVPCLLRARMTRELGHAALASSGPSALVLPPTHLGHLPGARYLLAVTTEGSSTWARGASGLGGGDVARAHGNYHRFSTSQPSCGTWKWKMGVYSTIERTIPSDEWNIGRYSMSRLQARSGCRSPVADQVLSAKALLDATPPSETLPLPHDR